MSNFVDPNEKFSEADKPKEKSDGVDLICGGPFHPCDKPAMLLCGGCETMRYCGRHCQKVHWSEHKKVCSLWKKTLSLGVGRDPFEVEVAEKMMLSMQNKQHDKMMMLLDLFAYKKHHAKLAPILTYKDRTQGYTLIHFACQHGRFDAAARLVALGVDVNARANDGTPAVMFAAQLGRIEHINLVVKAGANLELTHAVTGQTALMLATQRGYLDVVKYLCAAGALVDQKTDDGSFTSLLVAAEHGRTEVLKHLLHCGADVNFQRSDGQTALILALGEHVEVPSEVRLEIVHILLKSEALVNLKTKSGFSALLKACEQGMRDCAFTLLEAGADIHHQAHDGACPVRLACQNGQVEIVRRLLEMGASTECRDKRTGERGNGTPLMKAVDNRDVDMVKLLLAAGADVFAKTEAGWSPQSIAAHHKHPEIIALLEEAACNKLGTSNVTST
jgi:ankyrin repeat protein